jgi:drug/metabolite transporter (DMT)-like permease
MSPQNGLGALYGLGAALLFALTTPILKLFIPVYDLLPLAGLLYVGAGLDLGFFEISGGRLCRQYVR